jgi:hypothetical protein
VRSTSKQAVSHLKAVPWAVVARAGVLVGQRWNALSAKERTRLANLVRGSRGRPGNLSDKERGELRKLVGKLDLRGAGRELMPLLRGSRGRGKRR